MVVRLSWTVAYGNIQEKRGFAEIWIPHSKVRVLPPQPLKNETLQAIAGVFIFAHVVPKHPIIHTAKISIIGDLDGDFIVGVNDGPLIYREVGIVFCQNRYWGVVAMSAVPA